MAFMLINSARIRMPYSADTYWAARGLIHVENQIDGTYKTMTVSQALTRMRSVSAMLGPRHDKRGYKADERAAYLTFLEGMLGVVENAKRQGRPDRPEDVKQMYSDLPRKSPSIICSKPIEDTVWMRAKPLSKG